MKFVAYSLSFHFAVCASLFAQSFTLVTENTGLQKSIHSNGIAVADYDLDGDLDIYIVGAHRYDAQDEETWNHFYSSNGDGTYSDVTEQASVRGASHSPGVGIEGYQFGAAWGDYDNDGDPDLFLTNFGYNILYRNNGDLTFTDITDSAGLKGRENDHKRLAR